MPRLAGATNGEGQGGAIVKTDRNLIIQAVEEAQRVLAEYLEPGALRSAAGTIHKLVTVLDRPELAAALEPMKASRGLRLVEERRAENHVRRNARDGHSRPAGLVQRLPV